MSNHAGWPGTIREINDLPLAEKHAIYRTLLPDPVFALFNIDPAGQTSADAPAVKFRCPSGSRAVEISVFDPQETRDPVLHLHMGDTFNYQLVVMMVVVNDIQSPRFDVDVMPDGQPTQLGTRARNIPAEIRAMNFGLGPGQIRPGLRIFRATIPTFETFVSRLGQNLFFIEPLFYHNAIIFERYGFAYSRGLRQMHTIHQEFLPGGKLHAQLDGSTPFRQPDAWRTISGRSWAIHDGVLDHPFTDVQMYKHVNKHAGIQTFPDARW
ncbi:MAG: hypothetical protein GYB65_13195 [Chloroflexi bacterium]|nr:hypothetical protein [Chloroflexota bacterium]